MESRKKIVFLITKSNFGGAQRYVYELATNLPKDRYDIVVAFGGNGILKQKLEAAGIRTRTIPSLERDINILKEIRSWVELWKLYKEEEPDIVHLNSPKAGGSGALIARLIGISRIIYTTHGWTFLEPRSFMWRALAWLASWVTALLCDKIILVSEYENQHTNMPFVKDKLQVIHTAIPEIVFKQRNEARTALFDDQTINAHEQNIWLVTNAELNRNKNLYTAIDAVDEFNKRNEWKIFYTIVSDGELREALATYITERGLGDQITLLGYVDDARTYLLAFDMFLLSSKKEGLPYALLEAGAASLPSIASNVGGIPEIITDGESGLLIDPNDSSTITEALETLAFDTVLRVRISGAIKDHVTKEFALDDMVAATRAIYETV